MTYYQLKDRLARIVQHSAPSSLMDCVAMARTVRDPAARAEHYALLANEMAEWIEQQKIKGA